MQVFSNCFEHHELPLTRIQTVQSPTVVMQMALGQDQIPSAFTVDQHCELKDASANSKSVRYTNHPLEGEEIRHHLSEGKVPVKLALTWKDRVSFILTEQSYLKRVTFLDILKDESRALEREYQFDSDGLINAHELIALLADLLDWMGGEVLKDNPGKDMETASKEPVTAIP
jgi:recombination associated protein RdgC